MDVNSSWGRWEIKRGELQANPLPQGGSGFHRGHDGPLIFFLGPLSLAPPSSWGSSSSLILEFLSLTTPFLSRVFNLSLSQLRPSPPPTIMPTSSQPQKPQATLQPPALCLFLTIGSNATQRVVCGPAALAVPGSL